MVADVYVLLFPMVFDCPESFDDIGRELLLVFSEMDKGVAGECIVEYFFFVPEKLLEPAESLLYVVLVFVGNFEVVYCFCDWFFWTPDWFSVLPVEECFVRGIMCFDVWKKACDEWYLLEFFSKCEVIVEEDEDAFHACILWGCAIKDYVWKVIL